MFRPLPTLANALALVAALVVAPAALAEDLVTRQIRVEADVTLDAQGRITELAWVPGDTLENLVTPRIDARVRGWEFIPGSIDGVPAETHTSLTVQLGAEEMADGGLALKFLGAWTGPRTVSMVPPRYPEGGLRNNSDAHVMVDYEIQADGSVKVIDLDVATNAKGGVFASAVRKQAETMWRYVPERVGGRAVIVRRKAPVWFCVDSGPRSWCERRKARLADESAARAAETQPEPAAASVAVLKTDVRAQDI